MPSIKRNTWVFWFSLLAGPGAIAQNIGINATGAAPHPSALLDVNVAALAANNKNDGAVRLVDAETGEYVETLAHEIRDSYQAHVDQWLDDLHTRCLSRDIEHVCLTTDEPLERALFEYCARREHLF